MSSIVLELVQHIPNVITVEFQLDNGLCIHRGVLNPIRRSSNPAEHEFLIFPVHNLADIPARNHTFPKCLLVIKTGIPFGDNPAHGRGI
ncbi:hypothetical protein D3C76_1669950 [compost metagenome]